MLSPKPRTAHLSILLSQWWSSVCQRNHFFDKALRLHHVFPVCARVCFSNACKWLKSSVCLSVWCLPQVDPLRVLREGFRYDGEVPECTVDLFNSRTAAALRARLAAIYGWDLRDERVHVGRKGVEGWKLGRKKLGNRWVKRHERVWEWGEANSENQKGDKRRNRQMGWGLCLHWDLG